MKVKKIRIIAVILTICLITNIFTILTVAATEISIDNTVNIAVSCEEKIDYDSSSVSYSAALKVADEFDTADIVFCDTVG